MTLHLYSLKNRLSGIYERPVAEVYDSKEYFEYLSQSLALAEVPELNRYKEYDVYEVATMDSKSGIVVPGSVEFVGSLEALCTGYIACKDKKDEQRSEVGV